MDDAAGVGVLQRRGQFSRDPQGGAAGHARCHQPAQALALDVLHHQVVHAQDFAEVVDSDDVRVLQRCHRPGLAGKSLREVGARRELWTKQLDRDPTVELDVALDEG